MNIQLQFYVFNPPLGGVENYFIYAGKYFRSRGHHVSILCTRQGDLPEREIFDGMEIIRHPEFLPPKYAPWRRPDVFVAGLADFMRGMSPRPDAVISRHCFYAVASMKAYPGLKNALFLPPAALLASEDARMRQASLKLRTIHSLMRGGVARVEKAALQGMPNIATLSANMRDQLADFYRVDLSRTEIIPPGVDLERFKPRGENIAALKNKMNIPAGKIVILSVGRIVPEKNHEYLAQAFNLLEGGEYHWLQVGDGDTGALKAILGPRAEECSFSGVRSDIESCYNVADIFVLPSYFEPFGHVVLEALASGLPVIGLKPRPPEVCVANEEIITDGRVGLLVPDDSPERLAAAIKSLAADKPIRDEMGRRARALCENDYSWDRHFESVFAIISKS